MRNGPWDARFGTSPTTECKETGHIGTSVATMDQMLTTGSSSVDKMTGGGDCESLAPDSHIWLSERLAERQDGAWIVRRRTHGGQGSDHDPAIARLAI